MDYLDDIADRIPHVWLPDGRTSTLDLLGDGLTVLAGPNGARAASAPHDVPLAVRIVDPATADALGIGADGLVLVRPDGLPIARWVASADASSVSAAVSDSPSWNDPRGRRSRRVIPRSQVVHPLADGAQRSSAGATCRHRDSTSRPASTSTMPIAQPIAASRWARS